MKKAILVISFGTSYLDNLEKTIAPVENDIKAFFTDYTIRRAFTSGFIIRKIKERDGIEIDNVKKALTRLYEDGYKEVICQPTHIINGIEYDDMCNVISEFTDKMDIKVGRPLLSEATDYDDLVDALADEISDKDRLYLFMGHGTVHYANSAYPAFDYHLKAKGYKNAYVGTVEGFPELSDILEQIKNLDVKKVTLLPLMLVAGDHANNDMAGDDSWKSTLEGLGYSVDCNLKGLGEYERVRGIYINHIKDMLN